MQWLRNIGQMMRENIRHLEITFIEEPELAHMNNMGRIHVGLSDKATVIYNANDGVNQLWKTGATCERRDSRSVPIFQIWGDCGLEARFTYNRSPSFSTVPGREVESECSLVHLPNKSWCVLDSQKKDGVAKGVVPKAKSTRMLEEVMSLVLKETIVNVKNPTKDEHEDDNDDWKDGDSDSTYGKLVHVSIVRSSAFVYELTKSAVSSSPIHRERL